MRTVRLIQPRMTPQKPKLRVAAYARVSDSRLHHSLSTQVSYYSRLIQSHPDWELVGVYYDEGISGKEQSNRQGLQDLLKACDDGKIDRILTKSIARFGRNTVDLLSTVRVLRQKNIGITFEKEGIDSLSSEGELMLTLLASVAQEESHNISENLRKSLNRVNLIHLKISMATVGMVRIMSLSLMKQRLYDRCFNGSWTEIMSQ